MSPTEAALIQEFDAVLEREGLGALDVTGSVSRNGQPTHHLTPVSMRDASDTFLAWAREVMATHEFDSPRDRAVWELYAEGKTLNEILEQLARVPYLPGLPSRHDRTDRTAAERRLHRKDVERSIERVKRKAPPQPLINPWIKSQRDVAEKRRLALNESKGDPMPPTQEAKRRPIEYAYINLREGGLDIPGYTRKSRLEAMKDHRGLKQPLMGIPHAGGIDVLNVPTKDPKDPRRLTYTTITVPWDTIKAAFHVPLEREEVEAAA